LIFFATPRNLGSSFRGASRASEPGIHSSAISGGDLWIQIDLARIKNWRELKTDRPSALGGMDSGSDALRRPGMTGKCQNLIPVISGRDEVTSSGAQLRT
jgi:hypothetical protein